MRSFRAGASGGLLVLGPGLVLGGLLTSLGAGRALSRWFRCQHIARDVNVRDLRKKERMAVGDD